MIPRRLELRDFLAYSECSLDLRAVHVAVLAGPNGAGKSSLLDAVTFALWGEARARSHDQLIRGDAAMAAVKLTFEAGGVEYVVTRTRTRGKGSTLGLWRGEVALAGSSIANTQRVIDGIVRMDHETWVNTAFLAQGEADRFTRAAPSHRQEILGAILGIRDYDRVAERCRTEARERGRDADALHGRMEAAAATAAELPVRERALEEARARSAEAGLALDAAREAYADAEAREADAGRGVVEARSLRERHGAARVRSADAVGEVRRLAAEAERLEGLAADEARLHDLAIERAMLLADCDRLEAMAAVHAELSREEERLRAAFDERVSASSERAGAYRRAAADDLCPTCRRPIDAAARDALLAEAAGLAVERPARLDELDDLIAAGLKETARLREVRRRLRELEGVPAALAVAQGATARIPAVEAERARWLDASDAAAAEMAEASDRLNELAPVIAAAEEAAEERRHRHARVLAAELERGLRRDEEVRAEGAVEQSVEAARQEREVADLWGAARAAAADYAELAEAFGRRGVQQLLVDAALPEVEGAANALLARMSDRGLRVTLETQRESRSRDGAPIETLDVIIADGLGQRAYEMWSGGEKGRIDLAVRLALSDALARRRGADMRTLIIDEAFGAQDLDGRRRVVEAVRSVQDDFALVLVVTHVDDLRDVFPACISVRPGAGGSTISVS